MVKAIWVSALVGAVCAFLSSYLILKGWSLMGDALPTQLFPVLELILGLPYAVGAFYGFTRGIINDTYSSYHTPS